MARRNITMVEQTLHHLKGRTKKRSVFKIGRLIADLVEHSGERRAAKTMLATTEVDKEENGLVGMLQVWSHREGDVRTSGIARQGNLRYMKESILKWILWSTNNTVFKYLSGGFDGLSIDVGRHGERVLTTVNTRA